MCVCDVVAAVRLTFRFVRQTWPLLTVVSSAVVLIGTMSTWGAFGNPEVHLNRGERANPFPDIEEKARRWTEHRHRFEVPQWKLPEATSMWGSVRLVQRYR